MAKTIEQWYLELEDLNDSLQATKYAGDNGRLGMMEDCMSDAINHGFTWTETAEGGDHWSDLCLKYRAIEAEATKQ